MTKSWHRIVAYFAAALLFLSERSAVAQEEFAAVEAETASIMHLADAVTDDSATSSFQMQLDAVRAEISGLKAPAKPKFPTVEVHGVFQADSGWVHQDFDNMAAVRAVQINSGVPAATATGDIQDGASFRRARLSANGAVAPNMNYFLQMDFAFFGRPTFTDLWFEVTDVPVLGHVRAGQWKQPFSLEVVSSFRYTTFAERSLQFQAFSPFRHLAVGFYDWSDNERFTWAASVYRPGQDQYGGSLSDNGGYAGVARVTALPMWDDSTNGKSYLHTGFGYNFVAPKDRLARFRTVPEYYIGEQSGLLPAGTSGLAAPGNFNGIPFFVDTKSVAIDHYHMIGPELLYVDGPFSWQSEANLLWASRTNGDQAFFPGAYSQVGYFLTGEHRPYNRKQGAIDRIQVLHPVGRGGDACADWGWGAWEVAARVSHIDLDSGSIHGGRLTDLTLGLNWYMNNYSKLQFNYIRAFLDNPANTSTTTDIFGLRAQVDF